MHWEQLSVLFLAQRYFNMNTREAWSWTTDLPISRWPASVYIITFNSERTTHPIIQSNPRFHSNRLPAFWNLVFVVCIVRVQSSIAKLSMWHSATFLTAIATRPLWCLWVYTFPRSMSSNSNFHQSERPLFQLRIAGRVVLLRYIINNTLMFFVTYHHFTVLSL